MSEEVEKATAMETFEETKAIVQVHEFVYDSEMLDEGIDFDHSVHLVICGDDSDTFAIAMKKFLHAVVHGELDSVEQRFDEDGNQYVTNICFRSKLNANLIKEWTGEDKSSE